MATFRCHAMGVFRRLAGQSRAFSLISASHGYNHPRPVGNSVFWRTVVPPQSCTRGFRVNMEPTPNPDSMKFIPEDQVVLPKELGTGMVRGASWRCVACMGAGERKVCGRFTALHGPQTSREFSISASVIEVEVHHQRVPGPGLHFRQQARVRRLDGALSASLAELAAIIAPRGCLSFQVLRPLILSAIMDAFGEGKPIITAPAEPTSPASSQTRSPDGVSAVLGEAVWFARFCGHHGSVCDCRLSTATRTRKSSR
jgi:hypothetical protein